MTNEFISEFSSLEDPLTPGAEEPGISGTKPEELDELGEYEEVPFDAEALGAEEE